MWLSQWMVEFLFEGDAQWLVSSMAVHVSVL